jgi:hypothetical protein
METIFGIYILIFGISIGVINTIIIKILLKFLYFLILAESIAIVFRILLI